MLLAFGAGVLIAPLGGIAQSPRVYRVGWISLAKSDAPSPFLDAFQQGLEERGYIAGKNIVIDARLADGSRDRAGDEASAHVRSTAYVIVPRRCAA